MSRGKLSDPSNIMWELENYMDDNNDDMTMNQTTQIVRHAMKVVSPQVREPKVVRDGTIKRCDCGVPHHLHQTCCGWDNVIILDSNGVVITGSELESIWKQLNG